MTTRPETRVTTKFRKLFKAVFPDAFIYKIPDTFGTGGKRPFDMFCIVRGRKRDMTFCFEFKTKNKEQPTPYQAYNLALAEKNGANVRVVNEANMQDTLELMEKLVNG